MTFKVKTKGQNEGGNLLVPKLRFNEFKDEWKEISLKKAFTFFSTNSLARADLTEDGLIKNIHYGDIHQKFNNVLDVEKERLPYINPNIELNIKDNLCQNGDLIFADASEDYEGIGKAIEIINVGNNKVASGLHTIHARDIESTMSIGFKGYLFNTPIIHNQIRILANGFKVFGISKNDICNLTVRIPSKIEQEKISNFLILLDKKIELQKRKVDALKIYKRGLIKKVFAKLDGKQIPLKLILKETFNYAQKGHEYPHVTLSKDGIYEKTDRYNRDFLVKDSSKQYKITHKYDLCYNPANLKFGVICLNLYGSAIFSPIYVTFEINKNYHPEFVAYYLCRSEFINYIRRYEQGTVYERMAVNSTDFLKYNLTIPSYEKQEKIVKLLNSLENKINNNLKIYHDFEKIKKGLLQQMFI